MPFMAVAVKKKSTESKMTAVFGVPIYKYRNRTDANMIMKALVGCNNLIKWRQRGICLLCHDLF